MKKKFLLTGSAVIAGAAILGLASCGTGTEKVKRTATTGVKTTHNYVVAPDAPTYEGEGGEVDVHINYSGTSGVTRKKGSKNVSDPITNEQIGGGVLLPTWRALASYTNTTIKEATDYSKNSDSASWSNITSNNFASEEDASRTIDVVYNKTATLTTNAGKLQPLDEYIENGSMPNFAAYLEKNPDVKKMLTNNGHIYFTPYFDGQDDIERMFIMDTQLTKTVLDSTSGWDTGTTNGGANPSENVVQGGYYQPFMDSQFNYPDKETKVKVLFENTVKEVTIFQTTNIIKQQNELLANGCTGQQLAEQFRTYFNEAYKDLIENGYYENPSDLFISDSAAYNPDELIALMRIVKANPKMISGDENAEITTFFPRAASSNRIDNIFDFAQIWGVQGVDGEKGGFYFAGDGKVHALETTQASYDALEYLSQIYDEGLILNEFYTDALVPKGDKTGFLDRFYKKIRSDAAYGFMMYDYSAATCAANDASDGIGQDPSKRADAFKEEDEEGNIKYSQKGITAILAPLTYWATGSEWKPSDAITSRTGKTLTRYYESNRALKDASWAIPANADNKAGAVRLMDVMFSEIGQMVNNYGPTEYWAKPNTSAGDTVTGTYDQNKIYVSDDLVSGELSPIVSAQVKASLAGQTGDFWSYSREYLGSTHGVGNVRPKGVNLQATNAYAQAGIANVQSAFTVGSNGVAGDGTVMKLATISKVQQNGETIYTWDTSAPSGFTDEYTDNGHIYGSLTGFWSSDKLNNNTGFVSAITRGHTNDISTVAVKDDQKNVTTFNAVLQQFEAFNKNALYTYASSITGDNTYVPDYAKTTA